jgi:hypothetical protein
MIHHISIAARDPARVAAALAELIGGFVIAFPPKPGAFLAVGRDGHGTGVEVYPADTVLELGDARGAAFGRRAPAEPYGPVHMALSIDGDEAQVRALAARQGWTCRLCSRGGDFEVLELWLEDAFLVEVLTPPLAARYLAFAARMAGAGDPSTLMASHEPRGVLSTSN